jgi:hypothetical protein
MAKVPTHIPVDIKLNVEVRSVLNGDNLYQGVFLVKSDGTEQTLSEHILQLAEYSTTQALIKLGWTPPKEKTDGD